MCDTVLSGEVLLQAKVPEYRYRRAKVVVFAALRHFVSTCQFYFEASGSRQVPRAEGSGFPASAARHSITSSLRWGLFLDRLC